MTGVVPGLRLEHVLCFSDAPSIDEHVAEYSRLGFVPQTHSARWPPGLRNRFVGLWPEYLELVWVEDEAAFAAGTDPIRAFRSARRPFGLGIVCDDVPALHEAWTSRGIALPPVRFESPLGADPADPPSFAFQDILADVLPGVDAFALTSYYRPVPPTRRQVWVAPNSSFGLAGITFVSTTPDADARQWQQVLAPLEQVREVDGGFELLVGPHRLTWLSPLNHEQRYGLAWAADPNGADAIGALELLALDPQAVLDRAGAAGRPVRRLFDGGLLLEPSAYDGYRLVIRHGDLDGWVSWRTERLGTEHEVLRMDEFMGRGTPGVGEYVLRPATVADLAGIRALAAEVLPEAYDASTPEGYPGLLLTKYWSDAANTAVIDSAVEDLLVAETPFSGIVGVAHTAPYDERSRILWRLYVLPRLQGRGLGRALLAECLRRCPPSVDRLVTEYLAANEAAAAFYATAGFGRPREESVAWRGERVPVVYVDRPVLPNDG